MVALGSPRVDDWLRLKMSRVVYQRGQRKKVMFQGMVLQEEEKNKQRMSKIA